VVDLTSSLYLGLEHPSGALRPWRALTLGRPAALATDPLASSLEARLARLLGTEAAALGRSTTHLFVDLSPLTTPHTRMILDTAAYPALRWGAERAAGTGRRVETFRRADVRGLRRSLAAGPRGALILTDGLCCGCGAVAPLREYVSVARRHGAHLLIDDTQGVGILGTGSSERRPWGSGGGGTAAWLEVAGAPELIVVASLAKALGAPVAAIAGPASIVARWKRTSETRVHCSPPTTAELAALDRALVANRRYGDRLRSRLLRNISRFRTVLTAAGISPLGGFFPMQAVRLPTVAAARELHRRLWRARVYGVVQRGSDGAGRVTFLLTAAHSPEAIECAAEEIVRWASDSCDARSRRPWHCARCSARWREERAA
jgi:8-amino-7-oxononanoate synthase